jgi:HAD superfamily hydrolase (TIGR01490 family)
MLPSTPPSTPASNPGSSPPSDPSSDTTSNHATAAFFDVDNTIVRGPSSFHLARGLHRRGFFRARDIARFTWHAARYITLGERAIRLETLRAKALDLMAGHSVADVVAVAEDVYDEVLASRIYPGTKALLDAHVAAGHRVWIVTASPVEVGELVARRLGATGAIGTCAEHTDGVYTGRLVGTIVHGAVKADAVRSLAEREGVDLASSYAYGDSANDLAILSSVGHPVAVNPDGRLRKHARAQGWRVEDFRSSGRRRTARRSASVVSLAGAAWAFGLVARAAHRSLRGGPDL